MKYTYATVLLGILTIAFLTSCERRLLQEREPSGSQSAMDEHAEIDRVDSQTGIRFLSSWNEQQLNVQFRDMETYVQAFGAVELFIGIRCSSVLSASGRPPLNTSKQPDFRWHAISENPLPTDEVNANPNTVLVLSFNTFPSGSLLMTQRIFKAVSPSVSWREYEGDASVAFETVGGGWNLDIPWQMINAGSLPEWFDLSIVMLSTEGKDVLLTFPPENKKGPRSLISFVYSIQDTQAGGHEQVVNTAHTDQECSVVDSYTSTPFSWISLAQCDGPFVSGKAVNENGLLLRSSESGCFGLYHTNMFGGNFSALAEGSLLDGSEYGLMLMKVSHGTPDPDSFVRIIRSRNNQGQPVVRFYAQNKGENKIEEWWQQHPPFFEYILGDDEFGQEVLGFRILRDERTGCLRAGYKYQREVDGLLLNGWIEFPTIADWDQRSWVVCPFICSRQDEQAVALFAEVRVEATRRDDQDDRQTGFQVKRRSYTFSGVKGDALVLTFDPAFVPDGEKFVFWSEANYIPWWHIDDTCAVSYEFAEIWGGGTTWKGRKPGGCCEPMSDRLLRWSVVNVREANDARIIVQWVYMLANPEYQWWGLHDVLRPVVEEEFCFYPDGTGVRSLTYHPVTGTVYDTSWNEISEPMVIHRGGVLPSTCLSRTALSMINLQGDRDDYTYLQDPPQSIRPETKEWDEAIVRINLNHRPAVFISFSQSPETREKTFPSHYASWWGAYKNGWHIERKGGYEYEEDFWPFAHWPISKIPYEDHTKSNSKYIREPGHTSIMSVPGHPGAEATAVWAMLVGMTTTDDDNDVRSKTLSWLYPGTIQPIRGTCVFVENDYNHRALTFRNEGQPAVCAFQWVPEVVVVNPVLVIKQWGEELPEAIMLNNKMLEASSYRMSIEKEELILWIDGTFYQAFDVRISR